MEASIAKPTHYLNATHGAASWFLTKDHKRIALLYLFGVSFFFLLSEVPPPSWLALDAAAGASPGS